LELYGDDSPIRVVMPLLMEFYNANT